MKRIALIALVVLVAASVVLAAGCKKADKNVIRIGFIAPMTGDASTYGTSTKNGFTMAMEEAGGTVAGLTIQLFFEDDRNDATEAVNVATKLATQDKVHAIIGAVTTSCSIPISEVCEANEIVQITPTSTATRVTMDPERKTFIFRACFIDPFQGTVGATFALDTLKAKKVAVMFDQGNDYTVGLANAFKETFVAGGGAIVGWEAYAKDDVDFSAQLTKIAAAKPDILYLPDYYNKVSLIGQQALQKGITAVFLGGDGWDSSELDFAAMDGGYFTNHYSPGDTRQIVVDWVAKYTAQYGAAPDALATLGYDAGKLLLKAIETAGSNDTTAIRDALQAIRLDVVSGTVSYDADGNPTKAAVILRIKDGKQVYVATINP